MYQISQITVHIHNCSGITKRQYNFCCSFLYFSLSEEHPESGSTYVITDFTSKRVLKTQYIEYFDTQNTHTYRTTS